MHSLACTNTPVLNLTFIFIRVTFKILAQEFIQTTKTFTYNYSKILYPFVEFYVLSYGQKSMLMS